MRALALTKSRVFAALILLLSLGPLAVNVVRVLRCVRECTRTHGVVYTCWQAWDGLGFTGYVDPVFGCVVLEFSLSEQVNIG